MSSNVSTTIRVAAVQYAVGPDVNTNLETTLRMIDRAAEEDFHLLRSYHQRKPEMSASDQKGAPGKRGNAARRLSRTPRLSLNKKEIPHSGQLSGTLPHPKERTWTPGDEQ